MKLARLAVLLVLPLARVALGQAPPPQVAPFTDADVPGAARLTGSAGAVAPGANGKGVRPATPLRLEGLRLNAAEGSIGFWIRPAWSGGDGKAHRILATATADGHRLAIGKSDQGILRAEATSVGDRTVARADVRDWKPGQWHHVVVGWVSNRGVQVGLPLWVDRTCVDGPVTPHGVWGTSSTPTSLEIGEEGGRDTFDELIIRTDHKAEGAYGMIACVYRDWFRTAPYDAYAIDLEPTRVPSDRRAVVGFQKQFGLMGRRAGRWEPLVENVVRYSQWAYFDARTFITWSTSDPAVATIDKTGRLTATAAGRCRVTAQFRGASASYDLAVITPDRPDAGIICIELRPRFRNDAVKDRPAIGEMMTARVRFGNFGNSDLPAGTAVRFGVAPDSIRNWRHDSSERPSAYQSAVTARLLAPGEEDAVEFRFPNPAVSTWMLADLDPANRVDEVCEANNQLAELTDARPVQMGYSPKVLAECRQKPRWNHVGSLSYYDWLRSEKLRMDVMLREAVWPTTGPNGVEEAYRIDGFIPLQGGNWDDEPYNKEMAYCDGGFPVNEPVDLMAIDCAIIHEFGHTMLSQPDLYGYPVAAHNVFVTDEAGKPIAGSPELPIVRGDDTLPASPGVNVPCYSGYPSLMDGCQLWLHPSQAGHVMYYKGYRQDRFWGTQGRLVPTRANRLLVTDVDDHPLKGAAVYVYHVSQAPVQDSGAKYFADRPKFMGATDDEGRFTFPGETDQDWDDPETDVADGSKPVWNPFGTPASETAFTPNVWEVEGLLLVRIVSGAKSEVRFMDLTQFNCEFLAGDRVCGTYRLATSLSASATPTQLVRRPVPEAIRKENRAPVAVSPAEIHVKCGQAFTVDGSRSYDPEGQPLIFRWNVGEGWLMGSLSQSSTLKLVAPDKPGTREYKLWVNDGVRCSEAVTVKVVVEDR